MFVVARILFQLPVVWKSGGVHVGSKSEWKILMALGLVGAALRVTEFAGIVDGLPVSLVSFLIYLHPVWTIFFSRWLNNDPIDAFKVLKIGAALLGTSLICDLSSVNEFKHVLALWSPIVAGMLISLWICLSTRAQREGTSVVSISFYYDIFTLVPLLTYSLLRMDANDWMQTVTWISIPQNVLIMGAFTLITGVLPNYAFYFGLVRSTALAAALLMLFEPIASTLIAVWAWGEPISSSFYWGAILILLINLPDSVFIMLLSKRSRVFPSSLQKKLPAAVSK